MRRFQCLRTETAQNILDALQENVVLERVESYASLQAIVGEEVSHFAVCVLLAATGDPDQFISDYADLVVDSDVQQSIRPDEDVQDDE